MGDYLDGDMSAIDQAAEVVRERVRQHPQQVRVSLAEGASASEQERAAAEVARTVPPEVEVVTHRYRRFSPLE